MTLSSGEKKDNLPTRIHRSTKLANWILVAEHWEAPQNISAAATVAAKHNTTHQLPSLLSSTAVENGLIGDVRLVSYVKVNIGAH
jgi:hypothetical protein